MRSRKTCGWAGVVGIVGLVFAGVACADFPAAVKAFQSGDYDAARTEFLALAALGDGGSQFNLGAMSLHGQGTPKDEGMAVGWLLAATENGYQGLAPEKLSALKATLTDEQRREAQQILNTYGREALLRTALPEDRGSPLCPGFSHATPVDKKDPKMDFLETLPPGVAILDFTVGIDGHVRDPGVRVEVSSDPKVSLAARVIERLFQIHWRPASLDRMPVEARVALGVRAGRIIVGSASPWSTGEVHKIRAAAEQGDPNAGYVLGMMLLLDSKIMPEVKGRDFLLAAAQQGHPKAAYEVARRFQWLAFCQKDDRRLPWLHYAAAAGEPIAQLALAQEALLAPGSMNQQQVVEFLQHAVDSDDFYVKKHAVALLATSPFEPIRKPPAALAGAQALLDAPIQSDPQMFEAVAAAYAANGDFTNARLQEDLALKKAGKLGWNTTLMEGRLAVYLNGKPWYGDLFALPAK